MAERRAPGFNIPLEFYDGPEVKSIPRRIRAAAIGVWALCGNYSATKLFDGYVDAEALKQFGCTPAIRDALAATLNVRGELSPLWVEARNGGVQLTNWPKHQRTRDEVTTYRESEAERKRNERNGKRRPPTSEDSEMSGRTTNGRKAPVRSDDRDPKTETETETKTEASTRVNSGVRVQTVAADPNSAHTAIPARTCKDHPNGTLANCGPCARARQAAEAAEAAAAAEESEQRDLTEAERRTRRDLIDACPDCDDYGRLDDLTPCSHSARSLTNV